MKPCMFFSLFITSVCSHLQAQSPTLPDSIITLEYTYYYSLTNPVKSQQILDSLRVRNVDLPWELDWCQGDLYYNTGKYRLALYYFDKTAQYAEVKNNSKLYMHLLSTMMECYRMNNDFEKTMETSLQLVDLAKQLDRKAEIGRAYMFMATVVLQQENEKLAYEYFTLAEKNLQESQNYEYLYHFYLTFANLMTEHEEYDKAYEYIVKAESELKRMEENAKELSMPEDNITYEQGRLYALASEVLAKAGKFKEASAYYDKFMASPCAGDCRTKIYIVPYLLHVKDYEKSLSIAQERIDILRNETDTIGEDMSAALHFMITGHEMLGKTDEALLLTKQALSLEKNRHKKDLENASLELATIHNIREKESQLVEQAGMLKARNRLIVVFLIIIALATVCIILIVWNMNQTKKRNMAMVQQIKVMQRNRERLEQILKERTKEKREKLAAPASDKLSSEDIFTMADQRIRDEKLYLNPNLTRDEVINLLHVKRNDFIQAINNSTGMSFIDYINSIRLEEALTLLETSGQSMVIIAEKSGFGSERSFYRQFKQKYNMSPAEYKKLVE